MKKIFLLILLLLFKINVFAGIQPIDFESKAQLNLYNKIIYNIKCVVCKAQSIVDSDTDFSNSLQLLIANKIKDNKSENDITNYITERYGDQVLLNPPLDSGTFILWFMPIGLILMLLVLFYKNLKKLY